MRLILLKTIKKKERKLVPSENTIHSQTPNICIIYPRGRHRVALYLPREKSAGQKFTRSHIDTHTHQRDSHMAAHSRLHTQSRRYIAGDCEGGGGGKSHGGPKANWRGGGRGSGRRGTDAFKRTYTQTHTLAHADVHRGGHWRRHSGLFHVCARTSIENWFSEESERERERLNRATPLTSALLCVIRARGSRPRFSFFSFLYFFILFYFLLMGR